MKERLEELLKNAYSPYYNFKVAAIVVTKDGNLFGGVNVENANGTSICAERNAIADQQRPRAGGTAAGPDCQAE